MHGASPTVREEAGAVAVPAIEMTKTNPVRAGIAVDTDVDGARFWAVDVAADVILHDFF